jgi:hypothetical protein
MLSTNSVNTNENLINIIFAYLNVKDLSAVSSVCKTFHKMSKGYNNYWRESCIDYFSSACEQHSIFKKEDYQIDEYSQYKSNIEWKKMFKTGLQIKQNMIKEKKNNIPNFNEDINNIANEIYTALKGRIY